MASYHILSCLDLISCRTCTCLLETYLTKGARSSAFEQVQLRIQHSSRSTVLHVPAPTSVSLPVFPWSTHNGVEKSLQRSEQGFGPCSWDSRGDTDAKPNSKAQVAALTWLSRRRRLLLRF